MKLNRLFLPLIIAVGLLSTPAHATCFLRQSTASQVLWLPTFVDSTDGDTAETALTIANTDIKLSKAGGTTQTNKNSGGATHVATGDYYITLDATDTNTVGLLKVKVKVSGALPVWVDCEVVEEAVYDAFFAASAPGLVGTAQTGDSFSRLGAPAGASVSADVAAVKTQTAAIEVDTQDIQSRIPSALVAGRMVSDAVAISGDTGAADALEAHYDGTAGVIPGTGIQRRGTAAAGAAGSITLDAGASATTDFYRGGTVNIVAGTGAGQAGRQISAYNGTTKVATIIDNWAVNPSTDSVFEIWGTPSGSAPVDVVSISGDSAAADSLEAFLDGTGGVTLTASAFTLTTPIQSDVRQYGGSAGTFTSGQPTVRVSAGTGTGQLSLTAGATTVGTNNDKTGYTLSSAGIDAFADRSTTGHTTAGTWGGAWNAAGAAGDPWTTNLPGGYGVGTAGYIIGNNLNASVSSRQATVTFPTNFSSLSIDGSGRMLLQPTQTGVTIPTITTLTNGPADSSGVTTLLSRISSARAGYLDNLSAGAVATQVSVDDLPTNSEFAAALGTADDATLAAISALNNISASDVWAQVLDGAIPAECLLSIAATYAGGGLSQTGSTATYKNVGGSTTRMSIVISSPGNRTVTVTCPSP